MIEEVSEPKSASGARFEAVDVNHVSTIHPDIKVFEGLGGGVHHDQISAVAKDLHFDDLALSEFRRIWLGCLSGNVASAPASHRAGEGEREGGALQHSDAAAVGMGRPRRVGVIVFHQQTSYRGRGFRTLAC